MEITLNDKKLELNFGVRFIRELDKAMPLDAQQGKVKVNFGLGLTQVLTGMQTNNAGMLSIATYAAAYGNSPRPSQETIDNYLDSLTAAKLDKLFDDVKKAMLKSAQVQLTSKNMKA